MEIARFREPSFIASFICCVLVLILLLSERRNTVSTLSKEDTSAPRQFDEALSLTRSCLDRKDFASAYGYVDGSITHITFGCSIVRVGNGVY